MIEMGKMAMIGEVSDAIAEYFNSFSNQTFDADSFIGNDKIRRGSGAARFAGIAIQDEQGAQPTSFEKGSKVRFNLQIKANESVPKLRVFIKFASGMAGQEVTSVDHVIAEGGVTVGETVNSLIEIDTDHLRPGVYPIYFWLGDPDNMSLVYDVVDSVTRPLSIYSDGTGRAKGLIDIQSRLVNVDSSANRPRIGDLSVRSGYHGGQRK